MTSHRSVLNRGEATSARTSPRAAPTSRRSPRAARPARRAGDRRGEVDQAEDGPRGSVATSSSSTASSVTRRDRGPGADPAAYVLLARSHGRGEPQLLLPPRQPRPDVRRGVAAGDLARPEHRPGAGGLREPVEPEGAPVVALEVVRQQVPAPADRHQLVRLGVATAVLPGRAAAARGVAEPQPLAGRGSPGRPSPARDASTSGARENGESTVAARSASARRRSRVGQHLHHLRQRRQRRLREGAGEGARRAAPSATTIAIASSSSTTSGGIEPAGRQLVAAVDPAVGVDRVAEVAQPLDVAAQRPLRHLEPARQLGAGPEPVGLQQRQQPQRPGARVRHVDQSLAQSGQELTGSDPSVGDMALTHDVGEPETLTTEKVTDRRPPSPGVRQR